MDDFPIAVSGLVAGYGRKVVVEVPDLKFRRGHVTCIVGPSGCGKTTLLRNVLMLERPIAGHIFVESKALEPDGGPNLQAFRENSGVLFQSAAMFNSLTLAENVAFPILELARTSRALARQVALQKLALVGLADFADYLPARVSGGMRKRAGIARALARDPDFLFLDEPSAGLDPINCAELDEVILMIRDRLGTTIVVVTHEIPSLKRIADEAVMLGEKRVLATGPLEQVMAADHPMIVDFFHRRRSAPPSDKGTFGGRLGAAAPVT